MKEDTRLTLLWLAAIAIVVITLVFIVRNADATPVVRIPSASFGYRAALIRAAGEEFGLDAPVARIAAQLQQESGWDPQAASPYAQGLAQFTPATAAWLPQVCPSVGAPDPWDPHWSLRAVSCYDAWLHARAPGVTACDRWAMTLSAYNGGERTRERERAIAKRAGADADRWFKQTERFQSRSDAAWAQNRNYVRRILQVLEPAYLAADWPGTAVCNVA